MTDQEFRDLLDWWMASDPWPILEKDHHGRVTAFLEREAAKRCYKGLVDAYHRHVGDTA